MSWLEQDIKKTTGLICINFSLAIEKRELGEFWTACLSTGWLNDESSQPCLLEGFSFFCFLLGFLSVGDLYACSRLVEQWWCR